MDAYETLPVKVHFKLRQILAMASEDARYVYAIRRNPVALAINRQPIIRSTNLSRDDEIRSISNDLATSLRNIINEVIFHLEPLNDIMTIDVGKRIFGRIKPTDHDIIDLIEKRTKTSLGASEFIQPLIEAYDRFAKEDACKHIFFFGDTEESTKTRFKEHFIWLIKTVFVYYRLYETLMRRQKRQCAGCRDGVVLSITRHHIDLEFCSDNCVNDYSPIKIQ